MAINPLNFFNVGTQIGGVNSPAAGPGQMIRNILEQAQKKGLLQAQSEAQLGGAKELAKYKQDIAPTTKNVRILDREGNLGEPIEVGAADVVKTQPSAGLFDIFGDDDNGGSTPTPTPGVTASATPQLKAIKILEDNGQPVTDANIQAVIDNLGL